MKFQRYFATASAFLLCCFQVVLPQNKIDLNQVNFVKDTLGLQRLKEDALIRIVQDSTHTEILRFLEFEIISGNCFEAITTLEDWQKKDGGTAQGLFLLGTAYGMQGNIKRSLTAMEQAYGRDRKLGNNTLAMEIRFLRVKANPLGRPERVNRVFAQNSLEQVRKSQSNPQQMKVWERNRQELYAWLQERAWVYNSDSLWISWMCMDIGELSYLLNEPEIAKVWYQEAARRNPDLKEPVSFRLELTKPKNPTLRYAFMILAISIVGIGLWLYFKSQRSVENSGK